jgi:hypothetical protein
VHAALRVVGEDDVAQPRAAYRQLIEALRDDRLDLERAATVENLAASLPSLLPREVA